MLGRDAHDGSQLDREDLGLGQAQPDRSPAQEGVGLNRHVEIGQRFVAARVEGADDQRAPAQRRGRRAIGRDLLLLPRRILAVPEQKLRAKQPDAVRAEIHRGPGVPDRADIGPDLDAMAVPGDRGPGAPEPRFRPGRPVGCRALHTFGDEIGRRMRPHAARSAVHGQQRALGQRENRLSQAGDVGDAERYGPGSRRARSAHPRPYRPRGRCQGRAARPLSDSARGRRGSPARQRGQVSGSSRRRRGSRAPGAPHRRGPRGGCAAPRRPRRRNAPRRDPPPPARPRRRSIRRRRSPTGPGPAARHRRGTATAPQRSPPPARPARTATASHVARIWSAVRASAACSAAHSACGSAAASPGCTSGGASTEPGGCAAG